MGGDHGLEEIAGLRLLRPKVGNILQRHGITPALERDKTTTWRQFVRSHLDVLAATDFFTLRAVAQFPKCSTCLNHHFDSDGRSADSAAALRKQRLANVTSSSRPSSPPVPRKRRNDLGVSDPDHLPATVTIYIGGVEVPRRFPASSPVGGFRLV